MSMKPTRRGFLSMLAASPLLAKLSIPSKALEIWRAILDRYLLPKLADEFPLYSWKARKLPMHDVYRVVGWPISGAQLGYYCTMNVEGVDTVDAAIETLKRVPITLREAMNG